MGKPLVGEVVVVPFPHTDLAPGKRRPALVVATFPGDDLILAQITAQTHTGPLAVRINANDFISGRLQETSFVRTNRLFTVDQAVIVYTIGKVKPDKVNEVLVAIRRIFC